MILIVIGINLTCGTLKIRYFLKNFKIVKLIIRIITFDPYYKTRRKNFNYVEPQKSSGKQERIVSST